ncbi:MULTISPECIES: sigma 54-interacting transcriptional regulator [Pseudomonas]|uniref:sigma 54-interacting transcriptional regulator n=1 Tax=Pseudomonas TaxID=286 RepID=UPI0018ABED40|nr:MULTISPECIES: sigma-54 dependent transcriptional regulator [Pseudomonas]MBF8677655.1 sigma-54-dependent Fis family transcriptional regulator [Pseudomonas fulva]MBF8719817.1 sigma-54-dependent Fis family transcriptional regulator [Pseudomonas fulva]MBF8786024.1 sigma-54-dependent Fis family transcriptional regulator [Pseudomonas fulva]MBH3346222.1 sigma-54-dependent Fis family transcriptional regulator [Pseudomonas parafulva]MEC4024746.1 sigma-54 dependent transcriptional regulator [Pseudomo
MEALQIARLAGEMAATTQLERLAQIFLSAAVQAHGLEQGLCFQRDAEGGWLQPLASTSASLAVEELPAIDLGEQDNPLVYNLLAGQPCQIDDVLQLVAVGDSFDALRARLPSRAGLLAMPLLDACQQAQGVLVWVGGPDDLHAWRADPVWQALTAMYAGLFARLRERMAADRSARYEHSVRKAREAEQGRARAVRLLAAEFVGSSAAARRVREEMVNLADSHLSALITGETGAGKDHAAWLIHQASARAGKFVPVNCAAIPKDLIEAELFGSTRGAFTGATQARIGLVAEADGGTLFLDEIGDMPLELQSRLLRVLNEKKYRPVGATDERASDFRLICATHQPLPQMVRDGRFREDLYFRIRQLNLHLPALRERIEDVAPLVAHALLQHNRERQAHVAGIEPDALRLLEAHTFPGNVRELRSLVLAAAERTGNGEAICAESVSALMMYFEPPLAVPTDNQDDADALVQQLLATDNLPEAVDAFERMMIDIRMRQLDGSRSRAALSLGIPKRTLARKCQQWNLDDREVRSS